MRYSRQRELILQQVRSRCDHPTAEEIHRSVLEQCPALSLGTVYRNLNNLADQGEILRVPVPGQPDRYDRTLPQHSHMFCSRCGRLVDIPLPEEKLRKFLRRNIDLPIERHCLTLYGVCPDCLKKESN